MIKSRSAYSIRPRRIWLNGAGAQNGAGKVEELKKSLPYCDPETGTKNRVVERDPIAGLGLLGKEYDPFQENRQRERSGKDKDNRNPILGEGELGQEVSLFNRPDGYKSCRTSRNPLDQSAASDAEVDALRPKGRPGKVSITQAQRDPISGRGEFGREWDPIHKYAGRQRPWHQRAQDDPRYYKLSERPLVTKTDHKYLAGYYGKRGGRCNPVTGENAKSFEINQELKRSPRKGAKKTNPVTGENCESYTVSDKLNEKYLKTGSKKGGDGNPVTGENCKSFDFNVESKPATPRKPTSQAAGNPITGENCAAYSYSSEFKAKPNKPNVPQNPVTGENVKSFVLKLTEKEDPQMGRTRPSPSDLKNPLTGENCQSFTISNEERPRTAPSALNTPRSGSNPVTGEGCQHFVLCTGEKKVATAREPQKEAASNPLTGDNVRCFDINQELRVNRRPNESSKPVENGHSNGVSIDVQTPRSNPITGM